MFEGLDYSTIVQGGSVSVALVALFILYDKNKRDNKTFNNHLEHDLESRDKNTEVLTRLVDTIGNIKDWIKK